MVIEVTKTGNGSWQGGPANVGSYSVHEESTPLDASDTSGSTGTIKITVAENQDGSILLLNDEIELVDSGRGRTQGVIDSVSGNLTRVNASGGTRLGKTNVTVTAAPYSGTLGGAFAYYLSLVGITSGISVDASLSGRSVVFPGWTDILWLKLKQMCAVQQVDISLVSSNIVLRPPRTRVAELGKISEVSWATENAELAQNVVVNYYNNTQRSSSLVYPINPYADANILTIGVGESRTWSFPISSTLTSLNQPQPSSNVPPYYSGPLSVYSVLDDQENDVTALWDSSGGKISVTQDPDYGGNINITVIAPENGSGSYSIAGYADGKKFSSLKITGTGVFFNKQSIVVPTGAPASKTSRAIGTTIDSIYVSTPADAYFAAARAGTKYAAPAQSVRITASGVNRPGDNGQVTYPTFDNFNSGTSGTFSQFTSAWSGKTFTQFNDFYTASVADNFVNQAFGNVAGARVRWRSAQYRVRSADLTPVGVELDAEMDTLYSDFTAANTGMTFAAFTARWQGKTFSDFNTIPLWVG